MHRYRLKTAKILLLLLLMHICGCQTKREANENVSADSTFTNPLLPSGADPWAMYHDGNYYYIKSHDRQIILMKTPDITELSSAAKDTIWTAPEKGNYSRDIWAPEIHYLNEKWYVYFAADDGHNENHRMYVLENESNDPFEGTFKYKSKLKTKPDDHWAIDGSVFQDNGTLYFIWSGWVKAKAKAKKQSIYIAKMANPWTIRSKRVLLSSPEYKWERQYKFKSTWVPTHPIYVNEGPNIIKHGKKIHLIFSASGCWTPYYALGRLTANENRNLLNPESWIKAEEPILKASHEHEVYGTGHNSFFKSPDGTEDWILYHANDTPGGGCGRKRSPRAQKIHWTKNDIPVIGEPVATSRKLKKPAGTPVK